jgi:RHS repeat-associated protein
VRIAGNASPFWDVCRIENPHPLQMRQRVRHPASSQATSGADCWGQSFGVDAVANLTTMNVTQCNGTSLAATTDNNNHFTNTGYSYDAAGNMTNDGVNAYSFDAEDRIKSGASVNYSYDGNGLRVEKSNGTLYWRSITGDVLAETDLSGNTKNEYVYFAGRRIAWITSGNTYFLYMDQVGTIRTITQSNGTMCYDADYTPYGQEIPHTNSCGVTYNYKFTGYERDTETGLDYAFARYYSSRLGRFLSVDPLAGDAGDAQSLNRYAYVENNPRNLFDPLGMYPCDGNGRLTTVDPDGNVVVENPGLTGAPCTPPPQDILAEECFLYGFCDDGGATTIRVPLTPRNVKLLFYLKFGQTLNQCIQDVFGGDAAQVPVQTFKNAPILNATRTDAQLGDSSGRNNPTAGPFGTAYVASDTVFHASGPNVLNAIMGTFAHELGNMLDERLNPPGTTDRDYGYTYGDPQDPFDHDTGAQIEECVFGDLQGAKGNYSDY